MSDDSRAPGPSRIDERHRWYDLFSRGARDWLRHNAKLREAVRERMPELVKDADVLSRPSDRTVQVPVRFLEHYRFRLRDANQEEGVGQGEARPGDILRPGKGRRGQGSASEGGSGDGEFQFVFEFSVEELVDWIWEELELPELQPRSAGDVVAEDVVPEGWNRRGPRARLDRRRTLKEAVKRRSVQGEGAAPFSDDDLRFRQLKRRERPATQAVVVFILDVSASMDENRRRLAKTFFFWAVHGLRRQYGEVEVVFIAHTNEAWEIDEEQFFQVSATGGTVASSALELAHAIVTERYDPGRYNAYVFYASDGDNFGDDRHRAFDRLHALVGLTNFMGFVETPQNFLENGRSEMGRLFAALAARDLAVGSYTVHQHNDIWAAIDAFFRHEARQQQAGGEPA